VHLLSFTPTGDPPTVSYYFDYDEGTDKLYFVGSLLGTDKKHKIEFDGAVLFRILHEYDQYDSSVSVWNSESHKTLKAKELDVQPEIIEEV
jgi:hypothetical protein